jgi:transcriptional antiterminator RfaH
MPVLAPEPALYPECLFEQADHLGKGRVWWVLHTRSRQEKALARLLHDARIPFYLPLIPHRYLVRGRKVTSEVPLFAGYVFLLGDHDERLKALATYRVVRTLETRDQGGLWRDLRQVQRLIATRAPITPEDRLLPGMTVQIRNGPLAGLTGKILRGASGRRFVVQVDFIQKGASVLLDDCNLVQMDGEPMIR